jgi:hypothetical protein
MRILVFSFPHPGLTWMSSFPHVRGHVLAEALRRAGVEAAFRTLPVEGAWDVAICTEYEGDAVWLGKLQAGMVGLSARRFYCMIDGGPHEFSQPMIDWFAARGGVLVHLALRPLRDREHLVGVAVSDVRCDPSAARRDVFFDFPQNGSRRVWAIDRADVDAVRAALPRLALVGSGTADSPQREWFDRWVTYGVPHPEYVAGFTRCVAFVPGCRESMGLAIAEAQVAGACIAGRPDLVKPGMLLPAADAVDADLVVGLRRAMAADHAAIAREAAAHFSADAQARRVLAVLRADDDPRR